MLKNYLKIAFRNLRKNKGYSFINVGGLTIALASFIIILLYLNYEKSYDRWNKQLDRVYRVDTRVKGLNLQYSGAPDNLPSLLRGQVPEVAAVTHTGTWFIHEKKFVQWKNKGFYTDDWMSIDSNFFKVFPYHFLYGNAKHAFDASGCAILNEDFAKKYFGVSNPLGERFTVNGKLDFVVTGVVKQPPTPSHFKFNILLSGSHEYLDSLKGASGNTYLLVNHSVDATTFGKKLTRIFNASALADSSGWGAGNDISLLVEPLQSLHLHSILNKSKDAKSINIIFLLGLLIVLLACINYTNLSIAQSSHRAKEIGIRKVIGASRKHLILYFLLETTMVVIFSVFLSLILVEVLLPLINHLLHLNLILWNSYFLKRVMIQVFLAALLIIFLAGGYPSLVLSGFAPVKVLKGNTGFRGTNTWMRQGLLFIQLTAFVAFIACTLVIYKQVHFLSQGNYGLDMNGVVILQSQRNHRMTEAATIQQQITRLPGVVSVSNASVTLNTTSYSFQVEHQGHKQLLRITDVGYSFFKLMGIPIKKGRGFDLSRDRDSGNEIILNAAAAKEFGITDPGDMSLKIGNQNQQVIGIVANSLNTYNLKDSIQSEAYRLKSHEGVLNGYILVKLKKTDFDQTMEGIGKIWSRYEPGFPLRYTLLNQEFSSFLVQYRRLNNLFVLFSLISVLIALMGLLAMASFNIRQRTKEMSIRKILGASVSDLLKMINRSFLYLIGMANLIMIPVVYLLMQNWLNHFAYRIELPILSFVKTMALSIVLTILAVSCQSWKASKANPVDALKYE